MSQNTEIAPAPFPRTDRTTSKHKRKPKRHSGSLSLGERKRRETQRRRDEQRALVAQHRDRVLTFAEWCLLNAFSEATGHRILKSGEGPEVIRLSARRIGIKESANAAWQASRVRG